MTGRREAPVLDEARLGPKMRALSTKKRAFVIAMLVNGGNAAAAVITAGWEPGNANNAARRGYEFAHSPEIKEAMVEHATAYLGSKLGSWVAGIEKLALDNTVEPATRLKALKILSEHAGMVVETKHKVTVERTMSREESLRLETALKKELGMVTDAEYEIVEQPGIGYHPPDGSEGLEDLL